MNSRELMKALQLIEKQKGIDREEIFQAIENSLISACKKNFGTSQNIKVDINRETGDVKVYAQKEVTEDVYDAFLEISLEDAKAINPNYEYGDMVDILVTPQNFGRISAQAAKQVVVQKFREAEREKVYKQYVVKQNDIDTGVIRRIENKNVVVSLGPIDVVIPQKEQVATENYNVHDRLKVYIISVTKITKGARLTGSRSHPDLVKRLFELEVPEIYDGTIEIKGIVREAGSRTKIAVYSKNPNVDAIGSCIGNNSNRVNAIIKEIRGEKIDIINWSENPKFYIAESLKPCNVLAIELNEEERTAKVVVPDNQLSLGIGKEGQNVRLAAKLTGWKIDIKSEEQAKLTNFVDFDRQDIYIKEIEQKTEKIEDVEDNYEDILDIGFIEDNYEDISDIDFIEDVEE
ncbi:MAG: transcription termination/antitermination protein NusA [Clostridiales bacterium]|nr:transcription termination/antitermination protein NusA [Clostridiales bacterium]